MKTDHVLNVPLCDQILDAAAELWAVLKEETACKLYFIYLEKAGTYSTLCGEVAFLQTLLDELDPQVKYIYIEPVELGKASYRNSSPHWRDATIVYADGRVVWREYRRGDAVHPPSSNRADICAARTAAAAEAGAMYEVVTARNVARRIQECRICLTLIGNRNRCRGLNISRALAAVRAFAATRSCFTWGEATRLDGIDPAHAACAITKLYAERSVVLDVNKALSRETLLSRSLSSTPTKPFEPPTQSPVLKAMRLPPRGSFRDIDPELLDMNAWALPNPACMKHPAVYQQRYVAVVAWYDGASDLAIKEQTGMSPAQVQNLIRRCARRGSDSALGFVELIKGGYNRPYDRTRPGPQFDNRIERVVGGGWSGMFSNLLAQFEDVFVLITQRVLEYATSDHVPGKRMQWVTVQRDVIALLRNKVAAGLLSGNGYPFTTCKPLYMAVRGHCLELLKGHQSRWVAKRLGPDVADRARLGSGVEPLLTPNAPLQWVALDFHKIDAHTTVRVPTPGGAFLDVVLPRWWIGGAVCCESSMPLALSLSFSQQTTADCVLELAHRITTPPAADAGVGQYSVAPDGLWQPNQLLPELAHQGFDLVLMDRAWAHRSKEVVEKVSSTLGAAICFGSVRRWNQRYQIERLFREIAPTVQAVPSSVGNCPTDFLRRTSVKNAKKYNVDYLDIAQLIKAKLRELLEARNETSHYVGQLKRFRHLFVDPRSTFLPRPLPLERRHDNPLMWIDLSAQVSSGSNGDYRSPCIRKFTLRFYGEEIHRQPGLAGCEVLLQLHRDGLNVGRAFEIGTGRSLGAVHCNRRWNHANFSWAEYQLIRYQSQVAAGLAEVRAPASEFGDIQAQKLKRERRALEGVLPRATVETGTQTNQPAFDPDTKDRDHIELEEEMPDVLSRVFRPRSIDELAMEVEHGQ